MNEVPTKNLSNYARKMLIDGQIISLNSFNEIKSIVYEINKIGVNINQLTKIANETREANYSLLQEVINLQEILVEILTEKVEDIFGYN